MEGSEDIWDYGSSGTHLEISVDYFKMLLLHEHSKVARHIANSSTFFPHSAHMLHSCTSSIRIVCHEPLDSIEVYIS